MLVEEMLEDISSFSSTIGGIEFYGCSEEYRKLLSVCRRFGAPCASPSQTAEKAYLFIESHQGKSAFSRATEVEARSNGIAAWCFDGAVGVTQKKLREVQSQTDSVVIIDGLPELADHRRVILERFNALSGRGLLFALPEYLSDALLDSRIRKVTLSHVDKRPADKLAWLIGLVREILRDENGIVQRPRADILSQLPIKLLLALSRVPLGARVGDLRVLAAEIAESMRLNIELQPGQPFPPEELAVIFTRLFATTTSRGGPGFRLWVEGVSDCQILHIASRLAKQELGIDLEEGLSILPLGEGRDGGTSVATEVVLSEQTKRNKDIFLFDFDEPGKHARDELQILHQDVVLLDPKLSCSRSSSGVEIEDFISVDCLDRFYLANSNLRPELEVIRYKQPPARRIVVEGVDKETLVEWLEMNATLADLENVVFVLCDIRSRFSLRNLYSVGDLRTHRHSLENETSDTKHFGNRPSHWNC